MLIGLIAPPWLPTPPPSYGGTEQVVDLLARGLVARGHDVVLFATGDSSCPVPLRAVFDTPAQPMGDTVPEACHVLAAYEALAGVDVIHDHTILGPALCAASAKVPVVATNHGPFTDVTRPIFASSSQHASVIAISKAQAASAGPSVTIGALIPHGIEVDRFPVGRGDGGYVLFLGRMCADKGAHVAIDVARRAGLPIKLAAKCREPAEHRYFEEMVAPRLGSDAEFLGEVGGADKLRLIGDSIALVNPISWNEPFGLVMAEALACGTPVVTTRFGAAPEIVRHGVTGYVCADEGELVAAVRTVSTLERAACRRDAEQRWSVGRMVDDHVDLYSSVASRTELLSA